MRILDLALKDLIQILRDKKSLVFLAAMPIIFTFFMGFAYRGAIEPPHKDNRLPLAWVDENPQAALNHLLFKRLDESGIVRLLLMEAGQAGDALKKGEVAGILVIPPGFGDQVMNDQV